MKTNVSMCNNTCNRGIALAAALGIGLAAMAQAATIYVDAAMPSDSGNGLTPETAKLTIGAGIAASANSDIIEVNAGTYLIPTGTQLVINNFVFVAIGQ